jgi:hypothetical protein
MMMQDPIIYNPNPTIFTSKSSSANADVPLWMDFEDEEDKEEYSDNDNNVVEPIDQDEIFGASLLLLSQFLLITFF